METAADSRTSRESTGRLRAALGGVLAPLSFLIVVVLFLTFTARGEGFLTLDNWKNIVQSTAVVTILAVGMTAVIISGEIDLSVGQLVSVSGVMAAYSIATWKLPLSAGVAVAAVTGTLCGCISGLLRVYGRMPSFIATLGMMGVANGLALMISGGQNITDLPEGFSIFSRGELFGGPTAHGIPWPLILFLIAATAVHILLSKTSWGRSTYAVGGNRDAARLSGISVRRALITVFMLSGLMAGFAAVLQVSRTGVAQPNGGSGLELRAIAATVIGGTSLSGGAGGVFGTVVGAFLMAVIQNGCDLKSVPPHFQTIIIGSVIWLAAVYDSIRRKSSL
jgi:ribose transport system permease protein